MRKAAISRDILCTQVKMIILFDLLLVQVNRLLEYPDWLLTERSKICFYCEKLRHFSKAFQSFTIRDEDYLSELVTDPTLTVLVARILQCKNVITSDHFLVNELAHVGNRLAFEVALIYKATTRGFNKVVNSYLGDFVKSFDFNNPWDLIFVGDRLQVKMSEAAVAQIRRGWENLPREVEMSEPALAQMSAPAVAQFRRCRSSLRRKVGEEYLSQDSPSKFHLDKNKFLEQEQVLVGFQEEAANLLKQLASTTKKQLQVISIAGMAGLGKTTLAARLYNDPYVVSYFYVRSWITFTQIYQKRDLLLAVLRSVIEITDEICRMSDNMLAHALYRALNGQRYLIVVDDVWSSEAWDDFKRCFPDDNNGSRIMLTTRLKDVALHAQSYGSPLCLRFLTEEESFYLFKLKSFRDGHLIDKLSLIGKSIANNCWGLPLAIVVIAGILKNNYELDWWAQVADSVGSFILTDENQYMDTLALSYNHLPQHLRHCFLSFGAFREDHDIPVHKLICLWVAEGFIHQDGTNKNLEDVAHDYLMDLIRRSLVVVGKKGSNGEMKTCRIHGLLRDLCLRKAKEENFLTNIYKHNKHSYSCSHSLTNPSARSQLLLSTSFRTIPSKCSCYSSELSQSFFKDVSITLNTSELIRALDVSSIELFEFPSELLQLVHLRYLELRFRSGDPPESISHLTELQTLIMSSRKNMVVPVNIWKMIKLRHLRIRSGENLVNMSNVEEEPSLLEHLQSMSLVSPTRPCQQLLARTRNLQKLGLCGPLITKSGDLKCPDLGLLMHLETLKLLNTIPLCKAGRLSTSIIFPETLKNLTVSNTYLDWKEAWVFVMIPNLEVLKLKLYAFVGEVWETSPEAFPRLKYLKLDEMDIVTWITSHNHFPVLQRLQVYRCPYLMEIPEDFGNICTLEWIELSGCSDAATTSARDIQKDQESKGNDGIKILFNPGLTKSMHKRAGRSGY